MEFALTEEQQLLQQTVRQFALEKLLPNYARWDRGERFTKAGLKELATLGVLGLRIPEKFGGHQTDFVTCGVLNEEAARGDFNYTLFLQIEAIITELLVAFATPDVQAEWLPRMAAGEALVAIALTEPGAGSDAGNIATRATKVGDDYVLTGEKASITFAG